MINLYEIEIEFLKVYAMGIFMGWQFCRYRYNYGHKAPWTLIRSVRWNFLNLKFKK